MRAALAPPRRHRGTENATIALRDIRVGEEITCNYFDSAAIDTPLISGAVIFGVGWAVAGYLLLADPHEAARAVLPKQKIVRATRTI